VDNILRAPTLTARRCACRLNWSTEVTPATGVLQMFWPDPPIAYSPLLLGAPAFAQSGSGLQLDGRMMDE
jgi:hypothetical protein